MCYYAFTMNFGRCNCQFVAWDFHGFILIFIVFQCSFFHLTLWFDIIAALSAEHWCCVTQIQYGSPNITCCCYLYIDCT